MTQIALLIAFCLGSGSSPVQLKPDRIIDCWEISNSEWDSETFTFSKNGSFTHDCRDGRAIKSATGTWQIQSSNTIRLLKNGKPLAAIRFEFGSSLDRDALVFDGQTYAERSYWVAEQRLAGKISDPSEMIQLTEKSGAGYRIGFSEGRDAYFAVDLWPMKKSDIDRLKKLVVADLRARGLKPVNPIRYDIRGF